MTAERRDDAAEAAGEPDDGYLRGVCATCEWLGGKIIEVRGSDGRSAFVHRPSPLTGEYMKAYEELIADETRTAEQIVADSLPGEPGFVDGVLAILLWAGGGQVFRRSLLTRRTRAEKRYRPRASG